MSLRVLGYTPDGRPQYRDDGPARSFLRKGDWRVRDGLSWEVRDLIQRFHYSRDYGGGAAVQHVLVPADSVWAGPAWGAAVWHPAVYAIRRYGCLPLQLSRLVLRPDTPKNAATFLMRRSMGLLDREQWPVLLTYADTGQGHTGTIYKAAGWEQDGSGGGWNYYDPATGRQLASIQNGSFISCPDGWEARKTVKHRFVQRASSASSDAAGIQPDEGGPQPTTTLQLWETVP